MGINTPESTFGKFELKHPQKVFSDNGSGTFKEVKQYIWFQDQITKEQLLVLNSAAIKVDDCICVEPVDDSSLIAQGIQAAVVFDKDLSRDKIRNRIDALMEVSAEKLRLTPQQKAAMVDKALAIHGTTDRREEAYADLSLSRR